jgi:hypothetical protein
LYYDLHEKRWKYTDGTYVAEFADMPPPDLGYLATGVPTLARNILGQANLLEWVEEEDD